jgi:uncharacterized protein
MTPAPRVTADTNTLVSGVLRMRPDAAPVRFLDEWSAQHLTLVLSEHLLGEARATLAKPYFTQHITPARREAFLQQLRQDAVITPLTVHVQGIATHAEDDLVLATALSGNAQFVVTGDHKLLALKTYAGVIIVSVQAFLALLPGLTST